MLAEYCFPAKVFEPGADSLFPKKGSFLSFKGTYGWEGEAHGPEASDLSWKTGRTVWRRVTNAVARWLWEEAGALVSMVPKPQCAAPVD